MLSRGDQTKCKHTTGRYTLPPGEFLISEAGHIENNKLEGWL